MSHVDEGELYKALLDLPAEARDHLRNVVSLVGKCYLKGSDTFGLLIVVEESVFHVMPLGSDYEENMEMLAIAKSVMVKAHNPDSSDGEALH